MSFRQIPLLAFYQN